MSKTAYDKRPNIELFSRNTNNEIVIVCKVWMAYSQGKAAVSLYVGRGIKEKALRLVHRELFDKATYTKEMLFGSRDIIAHLWAMHFGVSDFVVTYTVPKMADLYHPSELQQLQQEKQP